MFPYIGGKAHHVKWMNPLFPNNFSTFVEVFGGAGWVSIKSEKVGFTQKHIYNDFNPLLANVFDCFRQDPTHVLAEMNKIPKSEVDRYKRYQKELFVDLDWSSISLGDFDLAIKYLYLQTQVFAGTALRIIKRLKSISVVEKMDCIDLIKKYDSKDTFFYVDPPYFKKEFYYSKDFPREKHKELADTLSNIKGKFALSYYDFDDLQAFYPETKFNWHRQSVYRSSATRSGNDEDYAEKSKGTEILIMNYKNCLYNA